MADAPVNALATAADIVNDRMSELSAISTAFNATLMGALNTLGNIKMDDVAEPPVLPIPEEAAPPLRLDRVPDLDVRTANFPSMPNAPSIDGLIGSLNLGDLQVPEAPAMPALNLPDAPTMRDLSLPAEPTIDTRIDYPEAPNLALPEMEALAQISIPAFTFPTLPDFDGNPPSVNFSAPEVFVNWAEPTYASILYDELIGKVRAWMQGGTGLPAHIEDALFSRARERDSSETRRAVQEAVDTWAARGFSMPPGMLVAQTNAVQEQGRLKAAELNRDILAQAAQWEIENLRFAVTQGIALEQLTQNLHENMTKRMFEVARFNAEMRVNVFNAQVSLFNAQNAAFATLVQVYRTKLDGALAKLQAYRAAIEAQQAIGQLNQQKVEVFKARLSAVQTSADLFTAMMKGAEVRAGVIAKEFDNYRTRVMAYAEQVGAEKVKFDAYESQVKGETAKAGMFEAQSRAYASTVQAVANKADLKVKEAQLRMDGARLKLQSFETDVSAYRAQMDAGLAQLRQQVDVFQSKVQAWQAEAQVNVSANEVQMRFADMHTRSNIAYAEMFISRYQANIQKAVQQAQIALEAAKAMGQYSAQLAAGAMSAMHVSAGINGSGTQSESFGINTSTNTNHNYTY